MEMTKEDRFKYHFLPQAVVESRWKEQKYVPEIMTFDGNFVLGPPEDSHEKAMTIAQKKTDEIIKAMTVTCRQFTVGLVKSKA